MPDRLHIGSEELAHYARKASARFGRTPLRAEDYEIMARTEETVQHFYAAAAYYVLAEAACGDDEGRASAYADLRARALEKVGQPEPLTLW